MWVGPAGRASVSWMSSRMAWKSLSSLRAWPSSRVPVSVRRTPRTLRTSSWVPSSSSSWRTCWLSAGWATSSCSAARVMDPASAMAAK